MLEQFLHHPIDTREELMEAYMVGHRLVKFLSHILPTHGDYHSDEEEDARYRSLEQLEAVLKYLDQIAVLVDKQEHEDYISSVLRNQPVRDFTNRDVSVRQISYSDDNNDVERDFTNRDVSFFDDNDVVDNEEVDDGDETRDQSYEHSFAEASDSIEGLHSAPILSAQTSDVSPVQPRRNLVQLATPRGPILDGTGTPTDHDRNATTDSVDILLESESYARPRRPYVTEDPASTPTNTLLRVRRGELTPDSSFSATSGGGSLAAGSVVSPKLSGESHAKKWLPPSVPPKPLAAVLPTPMVRNSKATPQRQEEANTTSFSNCQNTSEDSNLSNITPTTADDEVLLSPGGKVRSKVRAWPPKPDSPLKPSAQTDKFSASSEHSTASSSAPSLARPERPSTPLPVEHHAIAPLYPDDEQPILRQNSADSVNRHFKPLPETQKMADGADDRSALKIGSKSKIRHTWSDSYSGVRDAEHAERACFSSTSCSSASSLDQSADDEAGYNSINTSVEHLVVAPVVQLNDELPAARSLPSIGPLTRSHAVSAHERSTYDDFEYSSDIPRKHGHGANRMANAAVGRTRLRSEAQGRELGENRLGSDQRETDSAGIGRESATSESTGFDRVVDDLVTSSKVDLLLDALKLDVSTDSMGFPNPSAPAQLKDVATKDQSDFSGVRDVTSEVLSYQGTVKDTSVHSRPPERQETSTSSSSGLSSRNPLTHRLADQSDAGETSFGSVDFDPFTLQPLRTTTELGLTSSIRPIKVASAANRSRMSSSVWSSDSSTPDELTLYTEFEQQIDRTDEGVTVASLDGFPFVAALGTEVSVVRSQTRVAQRQSPHGCVVQKELNQISPHLGNSKGASFGGHSSPEDRRDPSMSLSKSSGRTPSLASTSYAPSAAEWSNDGIDGNYTKAQDNLSLPIDSMGFPSLSKSGNASEGSCDGPAAWVESTSGMSVVPTDRSMKGPDARPDVGISAFLVSLYDDQDISQHSIDDALPDSNHLQPKWPDTWNSCVQEAESYRDNITSLAEVDVKSDISPSSGFVHGDFGATSNPGLSQAAYTELWTAPERFQPGSRSQGAYISPRQRVRPAPLAYGMVAMEDRDMFQERMRCVALPHPFSSVSAFQHAPVPYGEPESPYMIESKVEQRLKLTRTADQDGVIKSSPMPSFDSNIDCSRGLLRSDKYDGKHRKDKAILPQSQGSCGFSIACRG